MNENSIEIGELEVDSPTIQLAREIRRLEDMERLLNIVSFIKNPFAKSFSVVENLELHVTQEKINDILGNIEIYDRYTNNKLSLPNYLSQIKSVKENVARLRIQIENEKSQK